MPDSWSKATNCPEYDDLGRRTQMIDASGTNTYAYSERGWLTNRTINFASQIPSVTLTYGYDVAGRPVVHQVLEHQRRVVHQHLGRAQPPGHRH